MGALIKGYYIPGTVLNREKMGGVTGDAKRRGTFPARVS